MAYQQEVASDELTYAIIGVAIDVHKALGSHQPEHFYQRAMLQGLRKRGFEVVEEKEVDVTYEGVVLGPGYVDLVVEEEVVIELKVVKRLSEAQFFQLGRNVQLAGASRGLLINFGEHRLNVQRWVQSAEGEPLMGRR